MDARTNIRILQNRNFLQTCVCAIIRIKSGRWSKKITQIRFFFREPYISISMGFRGSCVTVVLRYGRAADTPVFGTGCVGTSISVDNLEVASSVSFPFDVCCGSDPGAGGGGRDARKTFNDGNWIEDRFTTRCSFSSPGTRGRPADAATTFHLCHGSPPATSMSSLRIVVDHFSCMSRVFLEPLAVVEGN